MGTRIAEIRASMAGIKMRIRSEMEVLSANLLKEISWRSLERALGRMGKDWSEVEKLYTNILTMMDGDDDEDEDKRDAHLLFQTELFTLRDQVQDAIATSRGEEEAQDNLNRKDSQIRTLGERWTRAYHRIDTVLAQLKTRLEGEPINSLELLEHKSTRLDEIREQIIATDAIV